jgi:hypothetical protein
MIFFLAFFFLVLQETGDRRQETGDRRKPDGFRRRLVQQNWQRRY